MVDLVNSSALRHASTTLRTRHHTHIGSKENPWIDFRMVIMASLIARGRVPTTATVESHIMAAMLQLKGSPSVSSGSMPSFLGGFFKEKKTHLYQQTLAEVDLTFSIYGCTEAKKKKKKRVKISNKLRL